MTTTLHTEAVAPELLETLREMVARAALSDFFLVGGTSLALRFGHRISVDLDLFTSRPFDAARLAEDMETGVGLENIAITTNSVSGDVRSVKVDLIAHRYPMLAPVEIMDGIRMAALPDLAAMKLNAITNRGSKKDFRDYALLLDHFEHGQMLDFFSKKYQAYNRWHVEKSVCYFEDAEDDPDPVELQGMTWQDVKEKILQRCR